MSKKITGNDFSKQLNALVERAMNDGVAFQHVVCQLETSKSMLVMDMIVSQRQQAQFQMQEEMAGKIITPGGN